MFLEAEKSHDSQGTAQGWRQPPTVPMGHEKLFKHFSFKRPNVMFQVEKLRSLHKYLAWATFSFDAFLSL